MGIKWKKAEKQLLLEQLEKGILIENVVIPGRKTEFIRRRARRLGLILKLRHPKPTEEQEKKLRELKALGFSAKQIAGLNLMEWPHRTTNAIQKYFGKLKLVGKNRSHGAKNKKIWQNGEKQKFDDFLLEHSTALAPQQIAEKFDVKEATVTSRQRFLGVKTSLAQTLAIPYVRKKIKEANRQRARRMLLDFDGYIVGREERLRILAEKMRQKQTRFAPIENRLCKICGKTWLRHRKFFYKATVKTKIGSSWHFSRICVICLAKKRHQKMVARYQQKYSQQLK